MASLISLGDFFGWYLQITMIDVGSMDWDSKLAKSKEKLLL